MDFIHVRREVDLQILAKKDKKRRLFAETIFFNVSIGSIYQLAKASLFLLAKSLLNPRVLRKKRKNVVEDELRDK